MLLKAPVSPPLCREACVWIVIVCCCIYSLNLRYVRRHTGVCGMSVSVPSLQKPLGSPSFSILFHPSPYSPSHSRQLEKGLLSDISCTLCVLHHEMAQHLLASIMGSHFYLLHLCLSTANTRVHARLGCSLPRRQGPVPDTAWWKEDRWANHDSGH